MKRDIRINYDLIDMVIYNINLYYEALSDMEVSFSQIKGILENNTGKSIEALITNYDDLDKDIQLCKNELDNVRILLNDYITDMSVYIQPFYKGQMMRVDRNDVWWNLQSIENSTSKLSQAISFSRGNSYGSYSFDEEEIDNERYNYNLIEDIDRMAEITLRNINNNIDELWHIYNNRIVPFENTDDRYKARARDTYYNITGLGDVIGDFFSWVGEGFYDLLSGVLNGLVDFVKGIFSLAGGFLSYLGNGIVVLLSKPFGDIPNWAKDYVNNAQNYIDNAHNMIGTILKDPMIIVEGLAQEVSDQIDQEGICYFAGYTGAMFLGTKGLDKLTKATKGLITGQKSVNINLADDIANQASNKIDNLSSISDEIINTSQYTSFRDLMPLDEITRYDKYWNGVAEKISDEALWNQINFIKNGGITKHGGGAYKPAKISASVDMNTGDIYFGYNGANKFNPSRNTLHSELQRLIDTTKELASNDLSNPYASRNSYELWSVDNCAEVYATNNALRNGANIDRIFLNTKYFKDGTYAEPCANCKITFKGFAMPNK